MQSSRPTCVHRLRLQCSRGPTCPSTLGAVWPPHLGFGWQRRLNLLDKLGLVWLAAPAHLGSGRSKGPRWPDKMGFGHSVCSDRLGLYNHPTLSKR